MSLLNIRDKLKTPKDKLKPGVHLWLTLDNFDKLIRQLEMVPQYAPNEADLTVTALREYWNAMDTANKAALKGDNDLSNCRLTRNNEFYAPESGLTEVAKADKLYIKALFGANSPQYHQLSGIPFRTYKN